jgi:hypothetical protein
MCDDNKPNHARSTPALVFHLPDTQLSTLSIYNCSFTGIASPEGAVVVTGSGVNITLEDVGWQRCDGLPDSATYSVMSQDPVAAHALRVTAYGVDNYLMLRCASHGLAAEGST